MKISLNLIETDNQIRQSILSALAPEIDRTIKQSLLSIKNQIILLVKQALIQEPEYSSLVSGQLRYELGIPNPSVADRIVESVANTVSVQQSKVLINSLGVKGGLTINILGYQDIQGLISTDIASVFDAKGYYLPWLEWLLLKGNNPIIKKFEVKLGPNPKSRTGNAIMIKSSSNWSVPSAFAGTTTNNWFTRALDTIKDDTLQNLIQKEIEKFI